MKKVFFGDEYTSIVYAAELKVIYLALKNSTIRAWRLSKRDLNIHRQPSSNHNRGEAKK